MRHQKSGRILGRNSSHRKAMFRNMAASLFRHEQIRTTVPKAKELRRVAEPLITLAKIPNLANRRRAMSRLRGDPDYGLAIIDHPVWTLAQKELLERARVAAPQVIQHLVDR